MVSRQTARGDGVLEYRDVEARSVYVEFPVAAGREVANRFDKPVYFLVWTTTPWTLPANLAIAVGLDVKYAFVEYTRDGERRIGIVAEELRERAFALAKGAEDVKLRTESLTGDELAKRAE